MENKIVQSTLIIICSCLLFSCNLLLREKPNYIFLVKSGSSSCSACETNLLFWLLQDRSFSTIVYKLHITESSNELEKLRYFRLFKKKLDVKFINNDDHIIKWFTDTKYSPELALVRNNDTIFFKYQEIFNGVDISNQLKEKIDSLLLLAKKP